MKVVHRQSRWVVLAASCRRRPDAGRARRTGGRSGRGAACGRGPARGRRGRAGTGRWTAPGGAAGGASREHGAADPRAVSRDGRGAAARPREDVPAPGRSARAAGHSADLCRRSGRGARSGEAEVLRRPHDLRQSDESRCPRRRRRSSDSSRAARAWSRSTPRRRCSPTPTSTSRSWARSSSGTRRRTSSRSKSSQPSHPVMQGVQSFTAFDEPYVHTKHNTQDRTVLMERPDPAGTREPWTWVRTQGKGRVFYTASGHDERVWDRPEFQKMIENAVVWTLDGADAPGVPALRDAGRDLRRRLQRAELREPQSRAAVPDAVRTGAGDEVHADAGGVRPPAVRERTDDRQADRDGVRRARAGCGRSSRATIRTTSRTACPATT